MRPETEKKELMVNSKKCKLEITDVPIGNYFHRTKYDYYEANAILLLYDVTKSETFENLNEWVIKIEKNSSKNVYKALIGNKIDLESDRNVSSEQGEDYADQYIMNYFEVSAKEKTNVEETFMTITKELIESEEKKLKSLSKNIHISINKITGDIRKTFSVECTSIDTVMHIKEKIEEKEQISPEYQELIFNEIILENDKKLFEYNIKDNSKIDFKNLNEEFAVCFKGRCDIEFNSRLKKLYKIKNVKKIFKKESNSTSNKLQLFYKGILLEDERNLTDYNIENEDTIIVRQEGEDGENKNEIENMNSNNSLEDKIKEIENELNKKNEELEEIKSELNKKNEELNDKNIQLEEIKNELNKKNEELNEKNKQLEELSQQNENSNQNEKKIKNSNEIQNENENKNEIKELFKNDKIADDNKLEELVNEFKQLKVEKQELIDKNKKLEELINELKIQNSNAILPNINNEKSNDLSIKKDGYNINAREILELVNVIKKKEEEIKDLKKIIPFDIKQGEKLISITFISEEKKLYCSIICKNNDIFAKVENCFYEVHPEYRLEENNFTFNNIKIKRFQTLEENNIQDHDYIYLINQEK